MDASAVTDDDSRLDWSSSDTHRYELGTGPRARGKADVWRPSRSLVPKREDYMVGPDKLRAVRRLKDAVIELFAGGMVAAVSVQGGAGVGKTVACVVVANDPEVTEIYPDATLWVQLGHGSTAAHVVSEIARIVTVTGGSAMARDVRAEGEDDIDAAIAMARSWFAGRRILLVVDNVFPSSVKGSGGWMTYLREIPSAGSCVLFSTRVNDIACLSDSQIDFGVLERCDLPSQKDLFMAHLGIKEDDVRFKLHSYQKLSGICHGLQIALAIAASTVRLLGYNWDEAFERLKTHMWEMKQREQSSSGDRDRLASVFSVGLEALDKRGPPPGRSASETAMSWTDLYISLGVLESSNPRVPVGLLARMWNVSIETAEEICKTFATFALCQLSDDQRPDERRLQLHDLQLAYCKARPNPFASLKFTASEWHARLINGLIQTDYRACAPHVELSFTASYLVEAVASDMLPHGARNYLLDHLVHHMTQMPNGVKLATFVVADYRWLLMVAEKRGLQVATDNYHRVISRAMENSHRHMDAGDVSGLREILEILRDRVVPQATRSRAWSKRELPCALHSSKTASDPGLAHQLIRCRGSSHGTVLSGCDAGLESDGSYGVVSALLSSAKAHARLPWLLPVNSCLELGKVDGFRQNMHMKRFEPSCVKFLRRGSALVMVGTQDGLVYVFDIRTGEILNPVKESAWSNYDRIEPRHAMTCLDAAVPDCDSNADGEGIPEEGWIVSGHSDGVVRLWNLTSWKVTDAMKGPDRGIDRIRVSSDGKHIAAWSKREPHVWLWDLTSCSGWSRTRVRGCCNAAAFELACGAALRTCQLAIIEHSFGTVHLAQEATPTAFPTTSRLILPDFGNLHESKAHEFCACTRSRQGECVVSLSKTDKGLWCIAVMDLISGKHQSDCFVDGLRDVSCVGAFCRLDNELVVVTGGHLDQDLQLWLARTGERIGSLRGHSAGMVDVAVDSATRRIVSISLEGSMRIWSTADAEGDGNASNIFQNETDFARGDSSAAQFHKFPVDSVDVSEDGSTVVTCSVHESMVLAWDAATGKCREVIYVPAGTRPMEVTVSALGEMIVTAGAACSGQNCFLNVRHSSGLRLTTIIADWNWVYSLSVSRNGSYCAAVLGNGNKFGSFRHTVWSLMSGNVTVEFDKTVVWTGTTEAAEVLQEYLKSLRLPSPQMHACRPTSCRRLRTESMKVNKLDIRPVSSRWTAALDASSSDELLTLCSCPARAYFDSPVVHGVVSLGYQSCLSSAESTRTVVACLASGRVAILRLITDRDLSYDET
jgi:WD40 repeat protein